jgi:hypothetical protein
LAAATAAELGAISNELMAASAGAKTAIGAGAGQAAVRRVAKIADALSVGSIARRVRGARNKYSKQSAAIRGNPSHLCLGSLSGGRSPLILLAVPQVVVPRKGSRNPQDNNSLPTGGTQAIEEIDARIAEVERKHALRRRTAAQLEKRTKEATRHSHLHESARTLQKSRISGLSICTGLHALFEKLGFFEKQAVQMAVQMQCGTSYMPRIPGKIRQSRNSERGDFGA